MTREKTLVRPALPPSGTGLATEDEDVVTCDKCGRPLPNLPRYLARSDTASGQFQCESCFYRGTGISRTKRAVIASAHATYWRQLVGELDYGETLDAFGRRRAA